MMKRLILTLLISFPLSHALAQKPKTVIAFGSCSKETKPQTFWKPVLQENADVWIWLGDVVYGDTYDMKVLASKYQKQKSNSDYQKLAVKTKVVGTWDDHDYGWNDAGKEYPYKNESKKLFLDFLDVSPNDEVTKHEGIYTSHVIGSGKQKVKLILLDTRTFRDSLTKMPGTSKNIAGRGDILGGEQWRWLEDELNHSDAAINIIGSSIQFIAQEHEFEKWANFPQAYERMLGLLQKTKVKTVMFVSGDRHIAELSKMNVDGLDYPLFDFTSSGLTHSWSDRREEANQYRIGDMIINKNYGLIIIDWRETTPSVTFLVKGDDGKTLMQHSHKFR